MTHNHYPTDPAHTFLAAKEVIARYGWGRTMGYQVLASPGFPRAIAGRYRLDTLIAWEEPQPAAEVVEAAAAITAARKAMPGSSQHPGRRPYAGDHGDGRGTERAMWRLIGILLVVWLVVTVVGAVVKGLFWLAVVGLLFFVGTAVLGSNRRRDELTGPRR